jgi:uncharacterized repeat protein (TIGR03806 family)
MNSLKTLWRGRGNGIDRYARWLLSVLVFNLLAATTAFAQAPVSTDFQRHVVAEGLDLPMEFEISQDGRAFVVGKCGAFYAWNLDGGVASQTSTVPNVRCEFEDGLLSVALDPDFTSNGYIYFQYTAPGSLTRVSRYTVNANNTLNLNSESILLEWQTGDEAHGHMGGALQFDTAGNLIITTGDNKAAGGYFQPAAQQTSGNTNDLRGKVLRIRPTAAGGYTIPAGNLFTGDATHRPEIYAMGFRNPFRLNIDPLTGYLYVGDIGPDASADSAEGPGGLDEINEIREAGNFGWPYIIGYNQPYAGFNPNNIVNNYNLNTGATNLPPSKSALWTIRHQATMSGPVYRFNESVDHDFKLPAYYNGKLIFWDFNSSRFFTIDLTANNNPPIAEPMPLNTNGFQGAIDAELDPRTHQLYVLQWGSGCCDKEPYGGGALYRFDHIGDRDNGTNISVGSTASATSAVGGNLAAYAVDGDPATRWESAASDPQTLNIELQQASTIGSIVITWENAYSSRYVIEGSMDGTNWDVLVNNTDGHGGTEFHLIDSTTEYRFIRLTGTERGTGYGHSIYEFEIFAGGDEEPPEDLTEFAYLNMPHTLDTQFTGVPRLLSQTGVFSNTVTMTPSENLLPFEPNAKLWSDRADKLRWISIPADKTINWHARDNWTYPQGTVAVKHFELPLNANNPAQTKRLETRLIVVQADGNIYGVTYKWRADNSDADLLMAGATENINITAADGSTWTQTWAYPSPTECTDCHNAESSKILGLSTRQLNKNFAYPGAGTQNQLVHWNNRNLFSPAFTNSQVSGFDKMVDISDTSASLEQRVKSYIDANCAHCHGVGKGGSQWDARYNTPLNQMQIVNANTTGIRNYLNDYGIDNAKVVAAGAPEESILYIRDKSVNPNDRMPPIGRALEHGEYIQVLEQWIDSLSGDEPEEPVGEELLSLNKPVTVSSYEGGFTGQSAVDGSATTRWGSEFEDPQWIRIDLEAAYRINRIVLTWEAAYGSAYVIEGSTDGNTWSNIVTRTNGTGGTETFDDLSGTYRYIRLTGTQRGTVWGYSLFEFEVWGGSSAPAPTINVLAPTTGQHYSQGQQVNLQVGISDANWFSNGGSFRYILDSNNPVEVISGTTISLGALAVGQHSVQVQLLNASGALTGTARTVQFTVDPGAPAEPELLSTGKTVTTSDIEGDYVGSNAVDGNMNTRWSSAHSDNQFIQIDLGESMTITRILLEWEGAYGSGYRIEVSDNGSSWTQIYNTTTGNGGTDDLTVNGQGRYVRLTGTVRATPWGYSLWEFQVWGTEPGGTDPTPTPQISITAPAAGQQYQQGTAVNLQVAISDSDWFADGGRYRYSLDGGAAVTVTNGNPVNLGALSVGNHSVQVTLVNNQGQTVGTSSSASFSVRESGGSTPDTPAPTKLIPVGSSASTSVGGNTAAGGFDGNRATRWESESADPQYLQADMGESVYLSRIRLDWEGAYARAYSIQISATGGSWQTIYETDNGIGGVVDLALDGQQGRYIRIYGTQRGTGYGYSLYDVDVYGIPADAGVAFINVDSPSAGQAIAEDQNVSLQVSITDSSWLSSGGSYRYSLDGNAPVTLASLTPVNLGILPTGRHTLRVSLLDDGGNEVGIPRTREFTVNCGDNCPNVLVFSKTSGFRHSSIEAGNAMVQDIADTYGFDITFSEDSSLFTTANLAQYSTIVFMNTTGDIFNTSQETAFRSYIENGGGFVGLHSAADTEHDWTWYTDTLLGGAEFIHHGDGIPQARVEIEQPGDVLVNHIGSEWTIGDEWYFWRDNPRNVGNIEVLANLDRSSYNSNYPVEDHPVIFKNTVSAGRAFYTAMGHVDANFSDPKMIEMIRKAIEWTSAD